MSNLSSLTGKLKYVLIGVVFYSMLDLFFRGGTPSLGPVALLLVFSGLSAFWITRGKRLSVILAALFAIGSATFLLSIGQGVLQPIFILVVSLLFVLIMFGLDRFFTPETRPSEAETVRLLDSGFNLNQTMVMFSVFFLASGLYGIYILTDIRPWQMMLSLFIDLYLASHYLIRINYLKSRELELHLDYFKNRTFDFYALLLPLLITELAWALTYLPINHLTFGAIILIMFYAYWTILRGYLRNELTRGRFLGAIAFAGTAVTLILSTSRLFLE